jgi:hypothetical protein
MRIPNSKSFRIALMALPLLALSLAAAQCPGGSGTPLTIANFKSGETIGHDLLLLKGVVATTAQQVTMSAGGDPISWPAGGGVYRGFVRLKPGANKVTVSSPGHQNACLDVTFAPNTYAAQVRLACLLPKGYKEGDPLFRAPAGEPNDGASMRKRVGFAALMQQSLIAELLGKAGKGHHSPHIVRDANGEPDVLMLQSDKTKEELEANKSDKAWPSAMSAIREHSDGRTRYMVFYSTMPVVIGIEGGVMKGLDNAYTWPQDLAELHSRWTDLRTPKELSVPGALTETYSLAAMLKSDFGFWFKMIGLFSMGVPNVDTATTDPFGQAYDKLNAIFLAKTERGENIIAENVALSAKSTAALAASPVLAIINPARSPALTAAETPAGLIQGVAYKYYEGDYSKLPDFATLTPKASGTTQVFDIQKRAVDDSFAFVFEAYLKVPQAGSYIFQISMTESTMNRERPRARPWKPACIASRSSISTGPANADCPCNGPIPEPRCKPYPPPPCKHRPPRSPCFPAALPAETYCVGNPAPRCSPWQGPAMFYRGWILRAGSKANCSKGHWPPANIASPCPHRRSRAGTRWCSKSGLRVRQLGRVEPELERQAQPAPGRGKGRPGHARILGNVPIAHLMKPVPCVNVGCDGATRRRPGDGEARIVLRQPVIGIPGHGRHLVGKYGLGGEVQGVNRQCVVIAIGIHAMGPAQSFRAEAHDRHARMAHQKGSREKSQGQFAVVGQLRSGAGQYAAHHQVVAELVLIFQPEDFGIGNALFGLGESHGRTQYHDSGDSPAMAFHPPPLRGAPRPCAVPSRWHRHAIG